MDLRKGDLSLDEIHKSIESTLNSIKQQHQEIEDSACDVTHLNKIAEQICLPISDTVRKNSATSLDALRLMLSLHESVVRATITGSPISESISRLKPYNREETNRRNVNSGVCILPPVVGSTNTPKQRSSFPLTRYPPIVNPTLSTSGSRGSTRLTSPQRRKTPPTSTVADAAEVSERHDALRRYVDDVEKYVRTLQGTFSTFTQRVLVPLQTFCKLQRSSGKTQPRDGGRSKENTEDNFFRTKSGDLHQSEFAIVQTMNRIRNLLWPPQEGINSELFTNTGLSKKVADCVAECNRFPVLRLLPDVLGKFAEVIQKSSFWLKRDVLYTQNAKSALHRAHRRYVKTERLWQEARQSHRQLLSEWEHMNAEVHTNSTRLETLEHDIDMLREDLDRSQDQRRTLEIKLRNTNDNIDHLRARHRALRKRIIMLGTKIEQRERNYDFMESRVRSQRADQDAMQEKIRISEEYAGSLQAKMEQFYNSRAAWNRRYLEKSDPEILRTRLQSVQLRIPLPAVREKTFILKSRLDNLREAFSYIEDGLEDSNVHWSSLCRHLKWPEEIFLTLPEINTQKNKAAVKPKDLTDSDDSSSTTSASSTSAGKTAPSAMRSEWRAAQRIVEHIKRRFPNQESQQRSFMLRMWLRCNGRKATIDDLSNGLRAVKLHDLAAYVERLVS